MEKWYENGLKFECQRCSFCCGNSPGFVYLSKADVEKLSAYFKMPEAEFIAQNCRWVNYYGGKTVLALKEKKNCDCWLWNGGCTAYAARPAQCAAYPFWTWMTDDEKTWSECAASCSGMNKGRLWSREEIEMQSGLYSAIVPLEKPEA